MCIKPLHIYCIYINTVIRLQIANKIKSLFYKLKIKVLT